MSKEGDKIMSFQRKQKKAKKDAVAIPLKSSKEPTKLDTALAQRGLLK